jgi:hypothetical protein
LGEPAGLFSEGAAREVEEVDHDRPFPESPGSDFEVSSSGDEQCTDSDDDVEAENVEGLAALSGLSANVDEDDAPAGFEVWHHGASFVRHLQSHVDPAVFLCGRLIGDAFVSGGSPPQPMCKQCLARV